MAVKLTACLLALSVSLLAGCGNDPSATIGSELLIKAKGMVKPPAAAPSATGAQPTPTEAAAALRKSLEAVGVPVLRVRIASIGADTFLTPRDTNAGTATWQTADGSTFTFRDGVLISTRAAVSDLMSAAVPSAGQILAASGSHKRSYFVLGDEDKTNRLDMDCTLSLIGAESVEVVGLAYATRHIRETCEGAGRAVQNEFWVDGSGRFRKSRQWVSDRLGYAEFFRVID